MHPGGGDSDGRPVYWQAVDPSCRLPPLSSSPPLLLRRSTPHATRVALISPHALRCRPYTPPNRPLKQLPAHADDGPSIVQTSDLRMSLVTFFMSWLALMCATLPCLS